MVYILLYWLYITGLFVVLGTLYQKVLRFLIHKTAFYLPITELTVINGIIFLMILTSITHFFLPINGYIHLSVLVIALCEVFFNTSSYRQLVKKLYKRVCQIPWFFLLLTMGFIIFFSYVATDQPVYNLDEGRYHFQALLWSKTYKIVPGLVNLHDRLGSNSSWYLLNALFDVGFFSKKVFHIINPLTFLYLFLYGFISLHRLFKRPAISNLFGLIVLFYLIYNYVFWRYWYMLGVTPDMGVQFFVIVFAGQCLWLSFATHTDIKMNATYALLICLAAYMCRATGGVLFLGYLIILSLLIKNKKLKQVIGLHFITGFLIVLIVMARNIILSGYPLFPSTALSFFKPDWRFPEKFAYHISNFPPNHELFDFIGYRLNFKGLFDITRLQLLAKMFIAKNISLLGYFTLIPVLLIFTVISFIAVKKKQYIISGSVIACLTIIALIITGLVYRFGAGYVCIGICWPLTLLCHYHIKSLYHILYKYRYVLTSIAALGVLKIFIISTPISLSQTKFKYPFAWLKEITQNTFTLEEVPHSAIEKVHINNGYVNVSNYEIPCTHSRLPAWFSYKSDSCNRSIFICYKNYTTCEEGVAIVSIMNWMNDLPCVGSIYIGTETRTNNIADGFRFNASVTCLTDSTALNK